MIRMEQFKEFSQETDEGKLLLAALAILTSLDKEDIAEKKWGGSTHPDDAFKRVVDIANQVFYEDDWKSEKISRERNNKLSKIIK